MTDTVRWLRYLLSRLPIIGPKVRVIVAKEMLAKLDKVEKGFTSPVVRYVDNIAELGRSLKGFDWHLEEDLKLYKSLRIITFTKTSGAAYRLLERIELDGAPPNFEDYFKDTVNPRPLPLLDWYSNHASMVGFISSTILLLEEYTSVNTPTDDSNVYGGRESTASYSTLEFFKSRYFTFLVLDLIQSLRMVLNLEVRGTHEKGQKGA
jgi:hypothetical protein